MNLMAAMEEYQQAAPWARGGLAAFRSTCRAGDTRALTPEHLLDFGQSLEFRGLAASTQAGYRSAVRRFFHWLLEKDLASFSRRALEEALVQESRLAPPVRHRAMWGAEEWEVRQLMDAAYAAAPQLSPEKPSGRLATLSYLRNIAIVEVLRSTGARPSELVALRLGDLDLLQQVATAPDGRRLYFDLKSWGAVSHYLLMRSDPVDQPLLYRHLPLFARHDAGSAKGPLEPLSTRTINHILGNLSAMPGVTPRMLRVRFGRSVLAATMDERGTARLLGLKRLASVRRYGEG